MAILNIILKGQTIWSNHLWDIKDQKGCVFWDTLYFFCSLSLSLPSDLSIYHPFFYTLSFFLSFYLSFFFTHHSVFCIKTCSYTFYLLFLSSYVVWSIYNSFSLVLYFYPSFSLATNTSFQARSEPKLIEAVSSSIPSLI